MLTFYITFILVVGQFLRLMFVGEATSVVIIEIVDANPLLDVCKGIRIARLKKDVYKEDIRYYVLLDLMRSPELLKTIAKSLRFIEEHNTVKEYDEEEEDGERGKSNKVQSVAIKQRYMASFRKSFD